jgi:hypothetical protein
MLNFRYGPDGSVHVIDWYDKNQCHSSNPDVHNKTLGRIFKISHVNDKFVKVDLQKEPSERLVDLQLHRNDWYVRHARRILQERGPDPKVHARLKAMLQGNPDVTRKLRALWALHVTGGLDDADLVGLLAHENEYVRSWAIQLLGEGRNPSDAAMAKFAAMARSDGSALVRLYLASTLQRTAAAKRWDAVTGLLGRAEDKNDQNQPLMAWYAAEPLGELDPQRALAMAADSKLPRTFSFMVQRIAGLKTQAALKVLAERLARTTDLEQQKDLAGGISSIVAGR